jgi:hypothetical protein
MARRPKPRRPSDLIVKHYAMLSTLVLSHVLIRYSSRQSEGDVRGLSKAAQASLDRPDCY